MQKYLIRTLFEHESADYSDWGWDVNHPCVEKIAQINETSGNELIHLGRKKIRAKQFVGMMQLGDESIQVLPKIDDHSRGMTLMETERIASAASNLMVMLAYARNIHIHQLDLAHISTQRGNWFEWLTYLFASEMQRQLQLGVHRSYLEREETLELIRGKWNLSRQFTRHPMLVDQFDVRYSDFSANTNLNRVLLAATQQLMRLTNEVMNYRLLHIAYATFIEAGCSGDQPLNVNYHERVHFTRLEERFRTAYQLADLFLQGNVTNIFQGAKRYNAFMFDMNTLFEEFVAGFLSRHKQRIFGENAEQTRIVAQAKQRRIPFLVRHPGNQEIFKLKPDLLLFQNGKLQMIGDTKYKHLDMNADQRNISEGDSYQMHAYATAYNCPDVCLIYPQPENKPIREQYQITNYHAKIRTSSVNLHQRLDKPNCLIEEFRQIFAYETEEVKDAEI